MDGKFDRVCFGLKASLPIFMVTLWVILLTINVKGTPLSWPSPTTRFLRSVFMVGTSDGWAVGDGGIVHWDGTSWSNWQSPTYEALKSVYMLSSSDGWAVGAFGTIVHWDGTSWSNWQSPITNYTLLSVYMLDANDGWAVGTGGTIVHWDGTSWSTVPSPTTEQRLFSVFMEAPDNIWTVGDSGTIAHYDGASWETVPSPTTTDLKSLFMVSANDGWAVGTGGTIVHWDGTSWETVPSPTTSPLYSVFVVSASDGWAVGADGTILRLYGAEWNRVTSPTTTILHSSFMISANDGWAVGDGGTILRVIEAVQFQLTVEFVGSGTIYPVSGSYMHDEGSVVSVDATPEVGWRLDHWSLDGYNVGASDPYAITMDANHTLIAVFVEVDQSTPIASIDFSPTNPRIDETVSFDASASFDSDGTITSYAWDFGDGTTATGVTATHTYAEEGNYTVTLTVRDAGGISGTDYQEITVARAREIAVPFPLWILALVMGGIAGITVVAVYFKRRKPDEEVPKPAEPTITAEPPEPPAPAEKTEKDLRPQEEMPPQKVKAFPKLVAKCSDTIILLKSFIEDPSLTNDRKAWKGFREFISIAEQIEDEYAELIEIRNTLAILRRKRNEYRSAGLDDLADKTEGVIQSNYVESIRIMREIQEKLPHLGS